MELVALGVAGLPPGKAGVALLAVASKGARIDRIRLAEGAEGANEGLDLAGIGPVGSASGLRQGVKQECLVAAGRLADDEATGIQAGRQGGKRFRLVGDGAGASAAAVKHDDAGFADVTADHGLREGVRGSHRASSGASDCLRAFGRAEEAPSTHQALQESGRTTMMTAGPKPYRETVNPAARRVGRLPDTAHPAEAEPAQISPTPTDNREPPLAAWRSRRLARCLWPVGVDGPERHLCAMMRSSKTSSEGSRPWKRLPALAWTRPSVSFSFMASMRTSSRCCGAS